MITAYRAGRLSSSVAAYRRCLNLLMGSASRESVIATIRAEINNRTAVLDRYRDEREISRGNEAYYGAQIGEDE